MTDTTQLDAILHGAAIAEITDRAFLRITGPDATRWLNGMVTNNIKDLAPGEGNYNFLLNNQGRIMGDCTIYRELDGTEPAFLLETDKSQIETIHQLLDKFIIMDDVELTPALTDKLGILHIGPGAIGTLDVGLIWPAKPIGLAHANIVGDPLVLSIAPDQVEVWGDQTTVDWLRSLGDKEVSAETLESYRIYSGTPRYGTDIRNTETAKDLPQETAQTHALHFSKGCYLGQEIVERIHSRGQVHRTFARFKLTGSMPTLPAVLESNGKTVGELTSATNIDDSILALGYARREALDTNQPLTYPGGTATLNPKP
jgi:folate-binding protein YgfZ